MKISRLKQIIKEEISKNIYLKQASILDKLTSSSFDYNKLIKVLNILGPITPSGYK